MYLEHSVLLYFNIVLGLCVLLCVCFYVLYCTKHCMFLMWLPYGVINYNKMNQIVNTKNCIRKEKLG